MIPIALRSETNFYPMWVLGGVALSLFQGKTPWVDSACADCPSFLVLDAAPAPASTFVSGASGCYPGLAFCFIDPWTFAGICCLQLPYHPCKNGMHNTCFYSTGRHTPTIGVPNPSPALDKYFAPLGPEILSSTGAGVWRNSTGAFPDSTFVLDASQSAMRGFCESQPAIKGFQILIGPSR